MYKISLDLVPEKEHHVYHQLQELPRAEKMLIYELIGKTNKDSNALHHEENHILVSLIQKGLIRKNPYYSGRNYSYFILPGAPHLLNHLQRQCKNTPKERMTWKQLLKKLMKK